MHYSIPDEVRRVAEALHKGKFEAYLVGGCVRDLILGREPKDWDIATNAKPEAIQELFDDSVYENQFGTVGVKTESDDPRLKIVEVTTFRIEGKYTDKRHPDEVRFAKTIEEDLSRRDFTVNAMAIDPADANGAIIDPFSGAADLKDKTVRTVGDSKERFNEDALRLLRAVRFSVELGFEIEFNTRRAIESEAGLLEMISKERVRDELAKIIMAPRASDGIVLLESLDLLRYVLPELREGIGVGQNLHHIYSVFEHSVRSLEYTAKQGYSLPVRLAALLHDVGKPRTKAGDGLHSTFYQHEYVGARMVAKALDRLKFSRDIVERVVRLVRYHMFYYNVGEVSEAGVRRFLMRVGPEHIDDLLKVREADRIGSGVPKAFPYKLRHLLFMMEKVKHDPISPKMLKIGGEDIMRELAVPPGPKIGQVLAILLEEVIEDPAKNTEEHLAGRARALGALSEKELRVMAEKAKGVKDEFAAEEEREMKKKFHVA